MEKNYYKLSGNDDFDLGLSIRPPRIKMPKIKFPKPPKMNFGKFKPKISTKSFSKSIKSISKNFKGATKQIQKGISGIGGSIDRLTQGFGDQISQAGNLINQTGQSINTAVNSGMSAFQDYAQIPFEMGEQILDTGMGLVGNVAGGVLDLIGGSGGTYQESMPMDEGSQMAYDESIETASQEQQIYSDPTYGDYVLDANGEPLFFNEESNLAYYG